MLSDSAESEVDVEADALPAACPCCGYVTLVGRAEYDVCRICYWEDDGQDNATANQVRGGPNSTLSLSHARYNFIRYGICHPDRKDLLEKRAAVTNYTQARKFAFDERSSTLTEIGSNWSAMLSETDNNPSGAYFANGESVWYRRRYLDTTEELGAIKQVEWNDKLRIWHYRLIDERDEPVAKIWHYLLVDERDEPVTKWFAASDLKRNASILE